MNPPAFLWYGTIKPFPLLSISAKDKFSDGHGNMLIKLLSFIPIGDARGPEVDQGELLRYLSEIPWFPTAWLSEYIQWQVIDEQSTRATIQSQGVTASAVLDIDEKGQVIRLTAERYMEKKGQYDLERWSGQYEEYQEINGILVPTKVEVTWHLKSGDLSYFKGKITEIEHDSSSPY
jgi:hypothetical protein